MESVFIIILNWNGWRDTIACLESVFRSGHPHFRVIVCDNASTDGSLDRIAEWAEGRLQATCSTPSLDRLVSPPVAKPVRFVSTDFGATGEILGSGEPLILLQTGANRGFAGGVNVGVRLALQAAPDYVWILNNDTLVESTALEEMLRRMREKPQAGICGATVLYLDDPQVIQALGGSTFNPWIGRARHILGCAPLSNVNICQEEIENRLSYIVGASMLVRRRLLEEIGLLSERYFLFFEEIDWAMRARPRFGLAYSAGAVVYHREGASTRSNTRSARSSQLADFYSSRNRMLIMRQYFPWGILPAAMVVVAKAVWRLFAGEPYGCSAIIRGLCRGLSLRLQTEARVDL